MTDGTDDGRIRTFADRDKRIVMDPAKVDDRDDLSPFTVELEKTPGKVEQRQEERSERSKAVDHRYNAPVTTDYEKWASNPEQWDYPGIDTIPPSVLAERANERFNGAFENGVVDSFEEKPLDGGTKGRHSSGDVFLDLDVAAGNEDDPRFREPSTKSHELGHAIDYQSGEFTHYALSEAMLGKEFADEDAGELRTGTNWDVYREVEDISRKRRGSWENATDSRKDYREKPRELWADFYASYVMQPRATKRDAPNAVEKLRKLEETEAIDLPEGVSFLDA